MPLWLIVLVVLAIVVALALVVGVRRPRSIEDELNQASAAPPIAAAPSAQAPLATTIEGLIRSKATGKLEVTSGDQTWSLSISSLGISSTRKAAASRVRMPSRSRWPGRTRRRCSSRRLTSPARKRSCGRRPRRQGRGISRVCQGRGISRV